MRRVSHQASSRTDGPRATRPRPLGPDRHPKVERGGQGPERGEARVLAPAFLDAVKACRREEGTCPPTDGLLAHRLREPNLADALTEADDLAVLGGRLVPARPWCRWRLRNSSS